MGFQSSFDWWQGIVVFRKEQLIGQNIWVLGSNHSICKPLQTATWVDSIISSGLCFLGCYVRELSSLTCKIHSSATILWFYNGSSCSWLNEPNQLIACWSGKQLRRLSSASQGFALMCAPGAEESTAGLWGTGAKLANRKYYVSLYKTVNELYARCWGHGKNVRHGSCSYGAYTPAPLNNWQEV